MAFVWQGITLLLQLYLAVQSQQNNHEEEEAGPEWGEGQHDHSPRVGDECQARPCREKGFQSSGTAAAQHSWFRPAWGSHPAKAQLVAMQPLTPVIPVLCMELRLLKEKQEGR